MGGYVSPYRDNHQLESRMREIRPSGSEGGGAELNRLSLPLSLVPSLRDENRCHCLARAGVPPAVRK
jgi:hypothetical protein